jgi:hypothetical protein
VYVQRWAPVLFAARNDQIHHVAGDASALGVPLELLKPRTTFQPNSYYNSPPLPCRRPHKPLPLLAQSHPSKFARNNLRLSSATWKRGQEDVGLGGAVQNGVWKAFVGDYGEWMGWLVKFENEGGRWGIVITKDQDPIVGVGEVPLLGVDMWEHAYYLQVRCTTPGNLSDY